MGSTKVSFNLKKFLAQLVPSRLFLTKMKDHQKAIFITFDDGPTSPYTEDVLALLDQYDAKATFFVVGRTLSENPKVGQLIMSRGHTLANHSYSHKAFSRQTLKSQLNEISLATREMERVGWSARRVLFRAPQGQWNIFLVLLSLFRRFWCVHWSYNSMDYSNRSAEQIVDSFIREPVSSGEVVLFHDDADKCVKVLSIMLPIWQKEGFIFKAIS